VAGGRKRKLQAGSANVPARSDDEKIAELAKNFLRNLRPPKRLDLDDWCDKYRMLPRETSSEHGRWKTSRFPFHRRIMKCLSSSSRAREVVGVGRGR
jgi:phage terminase large subunit GpA-like protein